MSPRTVFLLLSAAVLCNALASESAIGSGKLTVISVGESGAAYCTSIPYPAAPQTTVLLDGQSIVCGSCDPNGRRDAEIEGYHLLLTSTSVLVYQAEDCSLHVTLTLDPSCAPRSLWISSREHRVYVTCNSTPKYMQINYKLDNDPETADFHLSELLPLESDASAPVNGTFISGDSSDGLRKEDYFLWIIDGLLHIYAAYEATRLPPEGVSARDLEYADDINCDTLTEVHALNEHMNGRPRFLLGCTRSGAKRLYEFVLHSGDNLRKLQPFAGSPIASPDGEFLVVVSESRTSIAIYKINDFSLHVPESFSGVIEEARFDQSGILSLVVRGINITLVNVKLFFSSGGTNGIMSLPGSATDCPAAGRCLPNEFVQEGQYLVMIKEGSIYEGRVYNLTDSSYTVVGSINGRPEAASFLIMTTSASAPPTSTPPNFSESHTPTADSTPTISFKENGQKQSHLSPKEAAALGICLVIVLLLIIAAIVAVVFRKTILRKLRNAKYSCRNIQEPIDQGPESGPRPPLTGASIPGTPTSSRSGTPLPIQDTGSHDESANSQLHSSNSLASSRRHAGGDTRFDSTAPLLPGSGDSSVASSRQPTPIPPHRGDALTGLGNESRGAEGDQRSESSPDGNENGTPPRTVTAATATSNGLHAHHRNLLSSNGRSEVEPSRELLLSPEQLGTS